MPTSEFASFCFAFDGEGFGYMETGGSHEGLVYGSFLGGGLILSNGDIEDQKEAFDYTSVAAGIGYTVAGTYSYGQSAMTGEDVRNLELLVGPGYGAGLAGGESYTYVQRVEYSQLCPLICPFWVDD